MLLDDEAFIHTQANSITNGKDVTQSEQELKVVPPLVVFNAAWKKAWILNIQEFNTKFRSSKKRFKEIQNIYGSEKCVSWRQSVDIQKQRLLASLITKNSMAYYSTIWNARKKKLVVITGDCRTRVGSSIKSFRRYRGRWEERIHDKNVNVRIIREHLAPQTCLYSFLKFFFIQTTLL